MEVDTYARMKTLAKFDRRTLSAMCAELISTALALPKYKEMYEEACLSVGEVPAKPDPRTARKQEHRPEPTANANPHEQLAARIKAEADAGRFHPDAPDMVEIDGGLLSADTTAEELAALAAHQSMVKATHVRPIRKTPEQQAKILELFKAGAISQEDVNRLMSPQVPDQGQPREEKEVDMRGDLLKTIGEQDSRLKKMEEMMKAIEMLKA